MAKIRLDGQFDQWMIDTDAGVLYDDGNNSYGINEVRAIFFYRQLQSNLIGNTYEIASLKSHLLEKIKSVKTPKVVIDWGDEIQVIKKG